MSRETLVGVVRAWASQRPDHTALIFLSGGALSASSWSYAQLDEKARCVAARLEATGLAGQRAVLLFEPGLEFVGAFFGCLYAGVIPIPLPPPESSHLDRTLPRLQATIRDAAPRVVLTGDGLFARADSILRRAPELISARWLSWETLEGGVEGGGWSGFEAGPEGLAFIQYTSGSTNTPKGVMIGHSNVVANLGMMATAAGQGSEAVCVSWLPLFHDMGLVGGLLLPLFLGGTAVMMSPACFLSRPGRWLAAMHHWKATMTAAPGFALDLCVRALGGRAPVGLDLRSLGAMVVGAEMLRPESLSRFAQVLAPCGFEPEVICQGYGLAEAVLAVTGGRPGERFEVGRFEPEALSEGRCVEDEEGRALVGCGRPFDGVRVEIVDPAREARCEEGELGEVWIKGPNVARGYWGRPRVTAQVFEAVLSDTGEGPFLRTGDMGFWRGGQLYIAGRIKDLIIIRGQNHFPEDIESTVECAHPRVRSGCTVAFSVCDKDGEHLVVVAEGDTSDLEGLGGIHRQQTLGEVIRAIRKAVGARHGMRVDGVVLIKPRTIARTSSGKLARHKCLSSFL